MTNVTDSLTRAEAWVFQTPSGEESAGCVTGTSDPTLTRPSQAGAVTTPVIGGLQACFELKNSGFESHTLVQATSAKGIQGDVRQGKDSRSRAQEVLTTTASCLNYTEGLSVEPG